MSEVITRFKPSNIRAFPVARDPEEVAIAALSFLGADEERLARFLDVSGINPAAIRAACEVPGFWLGVLDYVAADERLLAGLEEQGQLRPEAIMRARAALGPSD